MNLREEPKKEYTDKELLDDLMPKYQTLVKFYDDHVGTPCEQIRRDEIIEHYLSDVEDLKYYFNELLVEYGIVVKEAGLGNILDVNSAWSKKVQRYPSFDLNK